MFQIINKIIPIKLKVFVINKLDIYVFLKAYFIDFKRFRNSIWPNKLSKMNEDQLKAKITMYYHSIEKGLSNVNFRYGFGKKIIDILIDSLSEYNSKGFNKHNTAYGSGVSVIKAYLIKHQLKPSLKIEDSNYIGTLTQKLKYLENPIINYPNGGSKEITSENLISKAKLNFEELAASRFSIRDYSEGVVDLSAIYQAIEIASKTPSACNRQPWHTYIILDKNLIHRTLLTQGGLNGQGMNISHLLVISSNNYSFEDYKERNQGFIDAGMYSMSLLYSLTYLEIASCPLNAEMSIKKDKEIRKLLSIPSNMNIVMFISLGKYKKINKIPVSNRYKAREKITELGREEEH